MVLIKVPQPVDEGPSNRRSVPPPGSPERRAWEEAVMARLGVPGAAQVAPAWSQANRARAALGRGAVIEYQEAHNEAMTRASQANAERTLGLPDVTTWPAAPYDYHHGRRTAALAVHIGQDLGLGARDLEIVKLVGFLHDVGRALPWSHPDPEHPKRSVELAERVLPSVCTDPDLRHEVCRLVLGHSGCPGSDPRAGCAWDADMLEGGRLCPNTSEGARVVKARNGVLVTSWAKAPEHQLVYRKSLGWVG